MAISTYRVGEKTTDFVKELHRRVIRNVRYGEGAEPGCRAITKWQFLGQEAHAGQVLRVRKNGNHELRTIETGFLSSQRGADFQPYMRETISEDMFTKEKVADVMCANNGRIRRVVGNPERPEIINLVREFLTGNPDAKSLILNRF